MVSYSICDEEYPYYAQSCCDSGHGPQCDVTVPDLHTRCMASRDHEEPYHVSFIYRTNTPIWWVDF